jgi:hypothetical protein
MSQIINLTFNDGNNIKCNSDKLLKIEFYRQLLEDRDIDEVLDIEVKLISYENMKIILKFVEIDNEEIKEYFKDIDQVSEYTTSIMPEILVDYLKIFDVKNDFEYDSNLFKKIIQLKENSNYLQYDIFGDVLEYKWADNYRVIDKDILKEILIQNVNNVMINEFSNDTTIIIKNLSEKYINILFEFYDIDEDDIEDFFEKNEINDSTILNILKFTTITKDEFYNILIKNVDIILEDLTYIM